MTASPSQKIKDRIEILKVNHENLKLKLKQGGLGPLMEMQIKKKKLSIKDEIDTLERGLAKAVKQSSKEDTPPDPKPMVDQPIPPKKDGSHSDDWGVGKDLGNGNFEIEETKKTKNAA